MVGIDGFEPWTGIGGKYQASNPRLLVLGDTRLDAPLTDREAILRKIGGAPDLIFTNFEQAVLGRRHWEPGFREAVRTLWECTLFYNYNAAYAAGPGAAPLTAAMRLDPRHGQLLRDMLQAWKPTHVVVWGEPNWQALAVADAAWETQPAIPSGGGEEPCRSVTLGGQRSLFTRVAHPAAGFAYERWSQLLARFLQPAP